MRFLGGVCLLVCSLLVGSLLAWAPPASAHSFSKNSTMVAAVTSVSARGVEVQVLSGDDELQLTRSSGRTVVVLGYGGEPYLRFDPRGVSVNLHSPALALNATRFPPEREWRQLTRSRAPAAVDWQQVEAGDTYKWTDHRIHLITKATPAVALADPSKPRLLRRWTVPLVVDGEPAAVRGTLRYVPGGFDWLATIPELVLLALIVAAAIWIALARRADPEADEAADA